MGGIRHDDRAAERSEWRRMRMEMEDAHRRGLMHAPGGPRKRPAMERLLKACERTLDASGLAPLLARRAGHFVVETVEFAFPDLPDAFDGYTILQLSDLHVGSVPGQMAAAARRLAEWRIDLVALTGDFQNGSELHTHSIEDDMARLLAPLRPADGMVGILGNHDHHSVVPILERQGVRVLLNETVVVERRGQALSLVGTDDPHTFFTPAASRALSAPPVGFSVALVHTPELADVAAQAGHRLYLCGHTHGGQICPPNGRPLVTALHSHHDLARGRWRRGSMHGYTSRGLGCGEIPVRINAPAEATVIRLARKP